MNNEELRKKNVYVFLTAVLICTAVLGLLMGGTELTAGEVIDGL